ncbi:MAG: GntR family transcriptional regulator [bacterium]
MPRNPGIPHYRRIADNLLATLQAPGDTARPLPSENALAKRYGVARNTARRALEELRAQGLVHRLRGSGSFSQGRAVRLIFAFGYMLPAYSRLFSWMQHLLAGEGYRLIVRETGMRGEALSETFRLDEVRQAEAVFWYVASHPDGIRAATAARRQLPPQLPLVLVDDLLGLSLQGRHRVDLVHFDGQQAARLLVAKLASRGIRHPVLLNRSDLTIFAAQTTQTGFESELLARGIQDVAGHVFEDDVQRPSTLRRLFRPADRRSWKPGAILLHYPYEVEFRERCSQAGLRLPSGLPVIAIGQVEGRYRLPIDQRAMAQTCADLLLSRLRHPQRPNLHVAINLPVRATGQGTHAPGS